MIDTIKAMLLDFQEMELKTGVPRHLQIEVVPGKATVCIGVRRSGKSTFLLQIIAGLLERGVARENILYLNFFDDRLHNLGQAGLGQITEAYYSLYPDKKNAETVYCFFDELQMIEGWESFVDRLMRTEQCEVYISGSSAQMLSKEIATQMRGRALSWELFPFSFSEYLDSRKIKYQAPLSTRKRLLVQKAFTEFWETGAFPEVVSLDQRLRVKIHQEYFRAVLLRDLVERHNISHPRALMDLARRLLENIASLHSINSLTGHLKSLGHKAPKTSVADYLHWLEDAYFLFAIQIFDASLARRKANPQKIYCIDHALVRSVSSSILVNDGHLLENLVFTALRPNFPEIHYYKTKSGGEVDFIIRRPDRSLFLVQVCESLADPKTQKREINAINQAMAELNLKSATIVTREEEKELKVESGIIKILPAWRFLLERPA